MRRGKIDVRVIRIINSASFAVRIIGSSQSFEVSISPCINSQTKHGNTDCDEDNNADAVCTASLFN
jgi:hypothetical protein